MAKNPSVLLMILDKFLNLQGSASKHTLDYLHTNRTEVGKSTTRRQLVIKAKSVKSIPTPVDPYGY